MGASSSKHQHQILHRPPLTRHPAEQAATPPGRSPAMQAHSSIAASKASTAATHTEVSPAIFPPQPPQQLTLWEILKTKTSTIKPWGPQSPIGTHPRWICLFSRILPVMVPMLMWILLVHMLRLLTLPDTRALLLHWILLLWAWMVEPFLQLALMTYIRGNLFDLFTGTRSRR